jgi:hypothetical protein
LKNEKSKSPVDNKELLGITTRLLYATYI